MQSSYAWNCPCGRLCGKKHFYCPDCQGHWTYGTPHSNEPKSPRAYASSSHSDWSWDWPSDAQPRGRGAKQRGQKPWTRSASARARAAKGKSKGQQADTSSPFAQTSSSPWPTTEQTTNSTTPFPLQQPLTPSATALIPDNSDAELIQAVKLEYPDLTKAPLSIQTAVAKAEKRTTPKQLASGLHKTSSAVSNASKELKALRDAKSKHRERWLKHLHDSVRSWEQQLKLYTEQQANYNGLIQKARQDLGAARQTLEDLNKKAEDDSDQDVIPDDPTTGDAEAQALVQQVQTVLQACTRAACKEETMEISDDETAEPLNKRPRSVEPFGGSVKPGA